MKSKSTEKNQIKLFYKHCFAVGIFYFLTFSTKKCTKSWKMKLMTFLENKLFAKTWAKSTLQVEWLQATDGVGRQSEAWIRFL